VSTCYDFRHDKIGAYHFGYDDEILRIYLSHDDARVKQEIENELKEKVQYAFPAEPLVSEYWPTPRNQKQQSVSGASSGCSDYVPEVNIDETGSTACCSAGSQVHPNLEPGRLIQIANGNGIYTRTLIKNRLGLTVGHFEAAYGTAVRASADGHTWQQVGTLEQTINREIRIGDKDVYADFGLILVNNQTEASNNDYELVEFPRPSRHLYRVPVKVLGNDRTEEPNVELDLNPCAFPLYKGGPKCCNMHYIICERGTRQLTFSGDSGSPCILMEAGCETKKLLPLMVTGHITFPEGLPGFDPPKSVTMTIASRIDLGLDALKRQYDDWDQRLK